MSQNRSAAKPHGRARRRPHRRTKGGYGDPITRGLVHFRRQQALKALAASYPTATEWEDARDRV